jgi:hypothetical protein
LDEADLASQKSSVGTVVESCVDSGDIDEAAKDTDDEEQYEVVSAIASKDEDGAVEGGRLSRAKAGTFVVWANQYFYTSDQLPFDYVRVRMHPHWAKPEHLGHHAMSRALVPRHVGDARHDPIRTYMLLKAWALWRANLDGWARAPRSRELQFEHDERVL